MSSGIMLIVLLRAWLLLLVLNGSASNNYFQALKETRAKESCFCQVR